MNWKETLLQNEPITVELNDRKIRMINFIYTRRPTDGVWYENESHHIEINLIENELGQKWTKMNKWAECSFSAVIYVKVVNNFISLN